TKGARSSLPMFSSPLWPPIEPNGPFALRRRRFWPLFLTNKQAPKTSPVELHPRGEAPRRTYHRASRRELPGWGWRSSGHYARLIPILLTNCGIGRDDTAGRAFPPERIQRPTCLLLTPLSVRRLSKKMLILFRAWAGRKDSVVGADASMSKLIRIRP